MDPQSADTVLELVNELVKSYLNGEVTSNQDAIIGATSALIDVRDKIEELKQEYLLQMEQDYESICRDRQ